MDSTDSLDYQDLMDSLLCVSGAKLLHSGLSMSSYCADSPLIFANAGGGAIKGEGNFKIDIVGDSYFQGGDVLRTQEIIAPVGDIPSIYQSARYGNFCYRFTNLPAREYFVDFHFAEIVHTNGPKGMRVFDVFIQEEKVLSELDIYSIVGANKPLQIVNVRVSVGEDGDIIIRFEGIIGSPIVSGICIKQAPELPRSQVKHEHLKCDNCDAEISIMQSQKKIMTMKSITKYEKKIEELNTLCKRKADECYEAWMSLAAANQQLEKSRMELDNRFFENMRLDEAMKKQAAKLRDVSSQYECDKKLWSEALDSLEKKVKIMKIEHSQLSHEAHDCASSIPKLSKMISAVQELVAQYDDLKLKLNEEQVKRKKLFNEVQEAKGNIRVFCRCRPLSKEEVSIGCEMVVDFNAAKDGDLGILVNSSMKKIYKFDRVYSPRDNQVDVFADVSPMVTSVLDGYNVCIFAYGQTGTGKTFTMEGTEENRGVNYRTLQTLFRTAKDREETIKYDISVSVLEVYNEQIRDLLATSSTAKRLEIKQDSDGGHHVPGIVEAKVENIKEVWDVLQAGSNARAVGSNNVNEHSSRSHCMLCTLVSARNLISGECTKSKLWLIDLAGSERLAKTEVQGERLKEAQNINRSLSALGDVISALAIKSSHIPFRNSKLTHLLQDSLGGDSKTLMFVQISPSEHDIGETISSLNFATRVRGVELGPAKKQVDMAELQKLKIALDKAKQELKSKDEAMRKLEENFQNLEVKAKGKDQYCRNQQEKINELESQLGMKMELCEQLENRLSQFSEGVKRKEETCTSFQQKVKELENKLKEREQARSADIQYQVKELEKRMQERSQEFEHHSRVLQQKIRELENKLKREREKSESQLLHRKMKVEDNLRGHDQGGTCTPIVTVTNQRRMSNGFEFNPSSQRSLSSANRARNQGSDLLKGTESLRELRRKRDLHVQTKCAENSFLMEKKMTSSDESNKAKHLEPSKALARITRSTTKPDTTALKTCHITNTTKTKGWLR